MTENKIIWIAGYPKSGNTWLRSLLSAYTSENNTVNINSLHVFNASNRHLIDDAIGIKTSDLPLKNLRSLLPTAYRYLANENDAPFFIKTHDAYTPLKGNCIFPDDSTAAVIHLVRDPRDVALSCRYFWGLSQDEAIEILNDTERWLLRTRASMQIPIFLSDWSNNALSWMSTPHRRLTVRYEDLLADTASIFTDMLTFCGIKPNEDKILRSVEACNFKNLQAQERQKGYQGLPQAASAPFFRSGRSGSWVNELTRAQIGRIEKKHSHVMKILGYI